MDSFCLPAVWRCSHADKAQDLLLSFRTVVGRFWMFGASRWNESMLCACLSIIRLGFVGTVEPPLSWVQSSTSISDKVTLVHCAGSISSGSDKLSRFCAGTNTVSACSNLCNLESVVALDVVHRQLSAFPHAAMLRCRSMRRTEKWSWGLHRRRLSTHTHASCRNRVLVCLGIMGFLQQILWNRRAAKEQKMSLL